MSAVPARIEGYSFGKIKVSGREYTRDIVVSPEGVLDERWWRREGHLLQVEDVAKYVEEYKPAVVITGTGYFGAMRVDERVESYLAGKGIALLALKTSEAVREFNLRVGRGERVLGFFHLTC
ncbi:MAG: MTH938/NDUFAF3 family protein [Thermofilum sp.]